MSFAVEAKHLIKNFGDFCAVNDISFNVKRGETFAILGENGAGKSTIMRMITCRSPLSGGELYVENFDMKKYEREIRSILGIVPQENNLDPDLNVLENLLVYSRYFRISKDIPLTRSLELLDFIRLNKKKTQKLTRFSAG